MNKEADTIEPTIMGNRAPAMYEVMPMTRDVRRIIPTMRKLGNRMLLAVEDVFFKPGEQQGI